MGAMQTAFKRILHYVILAALLIGTPLVCCLLGGYDEILEGVKNFPPRTEDFGFYPEKLWNNRCPFNWWAFIGLVLFTAMCLKPFVRRACHVGRVALLRDRTPTRFPWWGWLGVAVLAAAGSSPGTGTSTGSRRSRSGCRCSSPTRRSGPGSSSS